MVIRDSIVIYLTVHYKWVTLKERKQAMLFVYALTDPCTGEIEYIGQTRNLEKRYSQHKVKTSARGIKLADWLDALREKSQTPGLVVLHRCDSREEAVVLEKLEIKARNPALNSKEWFPASRGADKVAFLNKIKGREKEYFEYLNGRSYE